LTYRGENERFERVSEEVDRLAHAVIGAAFEVHKLLGPGLLESVYEEALCVELKLRGIPFAHQVVVAVNYKGQAIGEGKLDILVDNALVVELKAVDTLLPVHSAQLLTYLKVTGHRLGLLINFNASALKYGIKRMVL
jgi:GxxExxY protein